MLKIGDKLTPGVNDESGIDEVYTVIGECEYDVDGGNKRVLHIQLECNSCRISTTFLAREVDPNKCGYSYNYYTLYRGDEEIVIENLELDGKTTARLERRCRKNKQKTYPGISEEEAKKEILNVVMKNPEYEPLLDDFFASFRGKENNCNTLESFVHTFDLEGDLGIQIRRYFEGVREDKLKRRICNIFDRRLKTNRGSTKERI